MRLLALLLVFAFGSFGQVERVSERLGIALGAGEDAALAQRELARRDYAGVQAVLTKHTTAQKGEKAELLSLQGVVAFLAGDMARAIGFFERASGMKPLDEADAFTLAMAFVRLGRDQDAASMLSGLVNAHPEKSLYLYWLGRIDYDLRRYAEAVEKLRRTVEMDPTSSRAWDSLGLTLAMQGELDGAYEAMTKAVALNKKLTHPSAWPPNDLGALCLRMERIREAEANLREALQYDPALPEAHWRLGRALEKEGQQAAAVDEYKSAIAEDASSPDACYSLATLYRKMGRNAEANAVFAEYKRRKEVGVQE